MLLFFFFFFFFTRHKVFEPKPKCYRVEDVCLFDPNPLFWNVSSPPLNIKRYLQISTSPALLAVMKIPALPSCCATFVLQVSALQPAVCNQNSSDPFLAAPLPLPPPPTLNHCVLDLIQPQTLQCCFTLFFLLSLSSFFFLYPFPVDGSLVYMKSVHICNLRAFGWCILFCSTPLISICMLDVEVTTHDD